MDNFYTEMKETLDGLSLNNPTCSVQLEDLESSNSYSFFPNIYAEALVPINLRKWPAFDAEAQWQVICQILEIRLKLPWITYLLQKNI